MDKFSNRDKLLVTGGSLVGLLNHLSLSKSVTTLCLFVMDAHAQFPKREEKLPFACIARLIYCMACKRYRFVSNAENRTFRVTAGTLPVGKFVGSTHRLLKD